MNERVLELAFKLFNEDDQSEPGTYIQLNVEKFAELIIQECIDTIVRDTANYQGEGMMAYYQGVQDAGKSIKQHFGVEEPKPVFGPGVNYRPTYPDQE